MYTLRRQQMGFTVVELLIVIVIIAILASISVVSYRGIQQRARLSSLHAAANQVQKAIELAKVASDNYPTAIDSCPTPTAGASCLNVPSNFTAAYALIPTGGSVAPLSAGTTARQSFALTLSSSDSVIYTSNAERTGTNEFLQYTDMAPIIDQHGVGQYEISFDIKSANILSASSVNVYMQNGSGARYTFSANVSVATDYERKTIKVTPVLSNTSMTNSILAYYGTYGTGNRPSVKDVKILKVN